LLEQQFHLKPWGALGQVEWWLNGKKGLELLLEDLSVL
jgi:hypothetical protein